MGWKVTGANPPGAELASDLIRVQPILAVLMGLRPTKWDENPAEILWGRGLAGVPWARPVATPNVFSMGCRGLSTVQAGSQPSLHPRARWFPPPETFPK